MTRSPATPTPLEFRRYRRKSLPHQKPTYRHDSTGIPAVEAGFSGIEDAEGFSWNIEVAPLLLLLDFVPRSNFRHVVIKLGKMDRIFTTFNQAATQRPLPILSAPLHGISITLSSLTTELKGCGCGFGSRPPRTASSLTTELKGCGSLQKHSSCRLPSDLHYPA